MCGVAGMLLAAVGSPASVLLTGENVSCLCSLTLTCFQCTDGNPQAEELLASNVQLNSKQFGGCSVSAQCLRWDRTATFAGNMDYVIIADW